MSDLELVEHAIHRTEKCREALIEFDLAESDNAGGPWRSELRRFRTFKRLLDELWEEIASKRLDDLSVKYDVAEAGTWGHKLKELRDGVYGVSRSIAPMERQLNDRLHQLSSLRVMIRNDAKFDAAGLQTPSTVIIVEGDNYGQVGQALAKCENHVPR